MIIKYFSTDYEFEYLLATVKIMSKEYYEF